MNQEKLNMGVATAQNRNIKLGLTVLEVMFAMVIVLTGLIGVAAMVPFAIRQAEDSYRINHALSAGENALAVFNSQSIVQPRLDAAWQFVDDEFAAVDSALVAGTWGHFYQGSEYRNNYLLLGLNLGNPDGIARLQNRMIGTGFCIDPLFWASQTRVRVPRLAWGNYRRSRFPFYQEAMPNSFEPLEDSVGIPTPRLRRISLADPLPTGTGNGGWLRLPAAIQVATVSGGDVVTAQPEEDRSAAPLRGEYVDGTGALIQSLTNGSTVSWMATLTPSDSTPIITSSSLNLTPQVPPNNPPPIETLPESYDLAVVVFGKRDVREDLDPSAIVASGIVPSSERIGNMVPVGTEFLTSGTFDIDVVAGPSVDPNMKIGDWVMLSRYVYENPYSPTIITAIRERHKWYRVISVGADDAFPVRIRLAGEPWGFTEHEIKLISNSMMLDSSLSFPPFPKTAVTMLKNVIQVYQRSITTKAF